MGAKIYGGSFWNIDKTYCLYMNDNFSGIGGGAFQLYNSTPDAFNPNSDLPFFSIENLNVIGGLEDFGAMLYTYGRPLLQVQHGPNSSSYAVSTPLGEWDFSEATVTGLRIA